MEARLLVEITSDEKGESSRYMPAESLDNLSLGVMIDRLECQGKWQIDLPLSKVFSDCWAHAVELRVNYLRQLRDIRLEDLPKLIK
jgi:membrane protein